MILSHQNHFKFGFNNEWFRLRATPEDVFTIAYGRCEREPGNFREESIRSAQLVAEIADAPIEVLFSGGVDSEVTMLSFLAAKVPITAAIMRFNADLNRHDIQYALRFCYAHGVPYRLYDIDIRQFLNERLLDYAIPTRCNAPMLAATMWLVDQIEGYPVLGQGECFLMRPERIRPNRLPNARIVAHNDISFAEDQWALQESETINGWYRHFVLRQRSGAPGFHQYTPEQMLSYLRDPMVVQMLQDPEQDTNEPWKLQFYQQHFDLEPRPKLTGYEKVAHLVNQLRTELVRLFPHAHSFVLFDYETLISELAR